MGSSRRRTVRCWRCGHVARRVPGLGRRRMSWWVFNRRGRIGVVGKRRTVQPYGA